MHSLLKISLLFISAFLCALHASPPDSPPETNDLIDEMINLVKHRMGLAEQLAKTKDALKMPDNEWFKAGVGQQMVDGVMKIAKKHHLDEKYTRTFFTNIMESCEMMQTGFQKHPQREELLEEVPLKGNDPKENLENIRVKIRQFNEKMVILLDKFLANANVGHCMEKVHKAIDNAKAEYKHQFKAEAFEHAMEHLCPNPNATLHADWTQGATQTQVMKAQNKRRDMNRTGKQRAAKRKNQGFH